MSTENNVDSIQLKSRRDLAYARNGIAWGLASGGVWGLDGIILAAALSLVPFTSGVSLIAAPLAAAALHDGFSSLWLFAYNISCGKFREIGRTLASRPGKLICLAALFGGPIGMAGYLLGIMHAGAPYAMAISATYPAVGSVLAVVFLKEKIPARAAMGILICIAGAIVVAFSPADTTHLHHFRLGLAFAALGALGWGLECAISTYGMDLIDPNIAVNIRQATSFVIYMFAVLPATGGVSIFVNAFHSNTILVMAVAGLLGAISYFAFYKSLNMAGVGRGMSLNLTYALWGIIFGAVFTGMKPTAALIAGAVIIAMGTFLVAGNPKELLALRNSASK